MRFMDTVDRNLDVVQTTPIREIYSDLSDLLSTMEKIFQAQTSGLAWDKIAATHLSRKIQIAPPQKKEVSDGQKKRLKGSLPNPFRSTCHGPPRPGVFWHTFLLRPLTPSLPPQGSSSLASALVLCAGTCEGKSP